MAAIQFPPVFPGDPQPVDGDTYLYIPNKEEYVCHRASMAQTPQWTQKGVISDSTFAYQGLANLAAPAPASQTGYIYSSQTAILAADINATWIGLAGQVDVPQFGLVIYANPTWVLINATTANPWIRTSGGTIQPRIDGDDLSMLTGEYLIDVLPDLPT